MFHLTKVSTDWAGTLGAGKTVKWPVGTPAEGNANLGALVTQTTIRNALESAPWGRTVDFNLLLVGIQGTGTWPITATTRIVRPRDMRKSPAGPRA